jgi:hypothetical protein
MLPGSLIEKSVPSFEKSLLKEFMHHSCDSMSLLCVKNVRKISQSQSLHKQMKRIEKTLSDQTNVLIKLCECKKMSVRITATICCNFFPAFRLMPHHDSSRFLPLPGLLPRPVRASATHSEHRAPHSSSTAAVLQ